MSDTGEQFSFKGLISQGFEGVYTSGIDEMAKKLMVIVSKWYAAPATDCDVGWEAKEPDAGNDEWEALGTDTAMRVEQAYCSGEAYCLTSGSLHQQQRVLLSFVDPGAGNDQDTEAGPPIITSERFTRRSSRGSTLL